mmetsp:Transcript_14719/g.16673  ORF Transcript_14719/g.16673 Transcript_14719/m.16673 type:complete len:87 (+) Transcript_14719:97-357(+)
MLVIRGIFPRVFLFFHESGMLTYFHHPSALRDIIVVRPQWLIHSITMLVFDRDFHGDSDVTDVEFDTFLDESIKQRSHVNICIKDY